MYSVDKINMDKKKDVIYQKHMCKNIVALNLDVEINSRCNNYVDSWKT